MRSWTSGQQSILFGQIIGLDQAQRLGRMSPVLTVLPLTCPKVSGKVADKPEFVADAHVSAAGFSNLGAKINATAPER